MTISEAVKAEVRMITGPSGTSWSAIPVFPVLPPPGNSLTTFITFRVVSGSPLSSHDGRTGLNLGSRFELTYWDPLVASAERGCLALESHFGDFRGKLGGSSGITATVSGLNGPRYLYDPPSRLHGVQIDLLVDYQEGDIS